MSAASQDNPLTVGLSEPMLPQPCTLVIFGGSGDLSRRKLLPAIYNLGLDGVLPLNFAVLGVSSSEMSDAEYREVARAGVERYSRQSMDEEHWPEYERRLFYQAGNIDDAALYEDLKQRLAAIEPEFGIPGNRIFYLAIPPRLIETVARRLKAAGLVSDAEAGGAFSRIIVEKPIGHDLPSARAVNEVVGNCFSEEQVYRIDHYLGKETVQNILVMRFGNAIFEPLWNSRYIDHVQITVAEEEGVGTRAGYYEGAGALRDMVQNHILQLLSLVAMEPPWSMAADVIRDHRLDVLHCLRPLTSENIDRHVVRAQYGPGYYQGDVVPAYRAEDRVDPASLTESYVALRVFIDNWRWAGVPFYIRTGKRLPKRVSEIAVQFKEVPHILFNTDSSEPLDANVLAMRLQPDEGMSLRIATKMPGSRVQIFPVKMDFRYGSTFGDQSPEAYERLLLDVMAGDATLFMRRDAVESSWQWIQPLLDHWAGDAHKALPEYAAGSWGPAAADRMLAADGRKWRVL